MTALLRGVLLTTLFITAALALPRRPQHDATWVAEPQYVYVSTSLAGHRSFVDQETIERAGQRYWFSQMVVAPDASHSLNRWVLDCQRQALRLSATTRYSSGGALIADFTYAEPDTHFRPIQPGTVAEHMWGLFCRAH